jgi:WD40 repeat protein
MQPGSLPVILLVFANERQDDTQYLRALPDECRAVQAALDPAVRAGLCEVRVLSNATIDDLFAALQDDRYRDRIAILHYGGHAGSFELLLEESDRRNVRAHGSGLVALLGKQRALQLVFLNGCNTEWQAAALNQAGIPLVIGTFEAIRDVQARQLAIQFYQAVGQGMPLGRSWNEATARILTEHGDTLRSVGFDATTPDRFPWDLFLKPGAEIVLQWNLPEAASNPLAGLPAVVGVSDLPEMPFRFLDRYKREDAPVFFGRARYIRDLYDRLTNPEGSPVVLLCGQSGVGKSSLLEAGLLPRLEAVCTVAYLRRLPEAGLSETLRAWLAAQIEVDAAAGWSEAWNAVERRDGRPLVVVLDQAEEAITQAAGGGMEELDAFADQLRTLFGDSRTRPAGKLLLSFRKEYEAEMVDVLKSRQIPRETVFLRKMTHPEIIEVVRGLTSTPRLVQKYDLRVEDRLPDAIAIDLLSDSDTPVAPVLQIILTKLWQTLPADGERIFTEQTYLALKEEGIFLGDFFQQQMDELRGWEERLRNGVESSGLALDVLHAHTTELGTSDNRALADMQTQYQHRSDVLDMLLKKFKELYLLTDAGADRNALAHDTLAPIVQREVKNSIRPAQKALRILTGKVHHAQRNPEGTFIDEDDLALVEKGRESMRLWMPEEQALIDRSRRRRRRLRLQRLALYAGLLVLTITAAYLGFTAFRQSRLEQWIAQARIIASTDPTRALPLLSAALSAEPESPLVMAALNDIFSNNEFYEHSSRHDEPVLGVALAPDSSGRIYSWTSRSLYGQQGSNRDSLAVPDLLSAALSTDGRWLLAGTAKGMVLRIDATNMLVEAQFALFPDRRVRLLTLSADGRTGFAVVQDSIVQFDAATLRATGRFADATAITALAFYPAHGTLLVGYVDGTAKEIAPPGKVVASWKPHRDAVLAFAPAADGRLVVSAGRDAVLHFHSLGVAMSLMIRAHDRAINAVAWSPDHDRLYSAGDDGRIRAWSPEGERIAEYKGHSGFVQGIAVRSDGAGFVSAGSDSTVRYWPAESKVQWRLGPHRNAVTGLEIMRDGRTVLTASDGGEARYGDDFLNQDFDMRAALADQPEPARHPREATAWDAATGRAVRRFAGHRGGINALALLPDDRRFITVSDDSTALLWTIGGSLPTALENVHSAEIVDVAVAPDGQRFVTVGYDRTAILWSVSGQIQRKIELRDEISCVAFNPTDGSFFIGRTGGATRYDASGQRLREYDCATTFAINRIACSPDGHTIALGENGSRTWILDAHGRTRYTIDLPEAHRSKGRSVLALQFSPDGHRLAIGTASGTAMVYHLLDHEAVMVRKLNNYPRKAVTALRFSADGQSLLTGDAGGWVKCWKLRPSSIFKI